MKCIGMRCSNPGSTIVSGSNFQPNFGSNIMFKQKDIEDDKISNLRGPY